MAKADDIWSRKRKKKVDLPNDLAIVLGIIMGFAFIWGIGRFADLSGDNLSNFYRSSYFTFFGVSSFVYNHKIRP